MKTLRLISVLVLFVAFSSCFSSIEWDGKSLSSGCSAADEQKSSFMPPIDGAQSVVHIDNRFTKEQQYEIERAIAVWNRFARRLIGHPFFTSVVETIADGASPVGQGECDFNSDDDDKGFWIIREEALQRWKSLNLTKRNGGATIRCTVGGRLSKQVVLLNASCGFKEQFMSVVLHELGHSLGLGHSCIDGVGRADYVGCGGLEWEHPYRVAAMHPLLTVYESGSPELKEILRQNDTDRASCLYSQ